MRRFGRPERGWRARTRGRVGSDRLLRPQACRWCRCVTAMFDAVGLGPRMLWCSRCANVSAHRLVVVGDVATRTMRIVRAVDLDAETYGPGRLGHPPFPHAGVPMRVP